MAIKKRADGRYQKRVTLRNGTVKSVFGRSLTEVNAKARALLADDSAGLEIDDDTTVGEWAKVWITTYKANVRPNTLQMYRDAYNLHILEYLGPLRLRDVRPVHCKRVLAAVADKSESLQHKVLITMRQLFDTARTNHLIADNPTEGLKITPHAKPGKKKYLTPAEASSLLQAVDEPRARVFVALCLCCGLRREEALGLRWTDITADRLVIARAVAFPGGSNQADPSMELKSKASARILPIPAPLRRILDDTPHLGEYVVPTVAGEIMTASAYRKMWGNHIQAVWPEPIHAHMLRHTYATTLYRAGVDLRTAQQLMGHASIQMTAKIYTHLQVEDGLQVVQRLDAFYAAPVFAG